MIAWVFLGPCAWSCSSIPSVVFVDESDASSPDAASSSAPDGGKDGAVTPLLDAATSADAATGCPTRPPPYAQVCCGSVPCSGACDEGCPTCQASCGAAEACCAKRNNVVCRPREGFSCN